MTVNVYSMFAQAPIGVAGAADPGSNLTLCMEFSLSQAAALTGIWFWSPSGATVLPTQAGIFATDSRHLIIFNRNITWTASAGSGWCKAPFDGQFELEANVHYQVAVFLASPGLQYGATGHFWDTGVGGSGLTSGIITTPNNANALVFQDSYIEPGGAGLTYPTTGNIANNYWVDVEVTTGLAAPSPPIAGFGITAPRTWAAGDQLTTPRLRQSVLNASALQNQGRPTWCALYQRNIPNGVKTLAGPISPLLDSWNIFPTQSSGTAQFYIPPLPGWYLLEGRGAGAPVSGGVSNSQFSWGFTWTQGTATIPFASTYGTSTGIAAGTTPARVGQSMADLVQFNPASNDLIGAWGFCGNMTAGSQFFLVWAAEWIGLPGSATINNVAYTGPTGVVVRSPKPASVWPPGNGTSLQGSVSVGGSVLSLPPTPGLRAGQVIGLDWLNGQQNATTAETATVQSVAGSVVTLTAGVQYGHNAGAAVAVPVSSAFLNEQLRDSVNFAFYPPMLRAVQGTASAQSIPNNTWTTVNLALTGTGINGITETLDNFGGWATKTANSYTIPVSGLYEVIGSALFAGSTATTSWGVRLIDNTGLTYSGDLYASGSTAGAVPESPCVRRLIRFTAGQTIALQCIQLSGGSVSLISAFNPDNAFSYAQYDLSRLVVIFRAF